MKMMGRLLVFCGPSGAGKDTVGEIVIRRSHFIRFPTYTTREARIGEVNGGHYHFVTVEAFSSLVNEGIIFDAVGVHNKYGVPLAKLTEAIGQGQNLLIHLATASAIRLKRVVPNAMVVLILPPSDDEAETRLRRRGMTQDMMARRREDEPAHNHVDSSYDRLFFTLLHIYAPH